VLSTVTGLPVMRSHTSNERLYLSLTVPISFKNPSCQREHRADIKRGGIGFFSARELWFDPVLRLALCDPE